MKFKVVILQRLLYGVVCMLKWSYRIEYVGLAHYRQAQAAHPQGSVLYACWHEHLIGMLCSHRNLHTIISRHNFGQILGYICRKFGYQIYFGSADRGQDKGGLKALLGLSRALKQGASAVVTVDGSVGPRRIAKQGVLELSRQSSAQIVPLVVASDRYWEFATWDRLKLPKPFARVVVAYGAPLAVVQRDNDGYAALSVRLGEAIDAAEVVAQCLRG